MIDKEAKEAFLRIRWEIEAPEYVYHSVEALFNMLCENELDSDDIDDAFGYCCQIRDWLTFGDHSNAKP